jgi:hypothetical protein
MAFVALKFKIARGLVANHHPLDNERLVMGIVSGLAKAFSHHLGHPHNA